MMNDSKPLYKTGIRNLWAFVSVLYTPFLAVMPMLILIDYLFDYATRLSTYGDTIQGLAFLLSFVLMATFHYFDVRDYVFFHSFFGDRVEIHYPLNKSRPTLVVPYEAITWCHWELSERGGRRTSAEDRFFFHWKGHEIPTKRKPTFLSRMTGLGPEGEDFKVENYCYIRWADSRDFVKVLDDTGLESKVVTSKHTPHGRLR